MRSKIPILLEFIQQQLRSLGDKGTAAAKKLPDRIDTVAYKIRLPRPADRSCNSTPMRDRWVTDDSYLQKGDPRYATEDTCDAIKAMLLAEACEFRGVDEPRDHVRTAAEEVLGRDLEPESATCFQTAEPLGLNDLVVATGISTYQVGSAELTVEYRTPLTEGGIHEAANVGWVRPPVEILSLRSILNNNGIPGSLLNKVQLKAYSTDKVTMPPHFSNRDYRWATWVDSNQFASRTDCRGVELQLLAQILEFQGAPRISAEHQAEVERHLGRALNLNDCRCPITGEPLMYEEFVDATNNPRPGKSAYHVGHLDPLTRGGKHYQANVVWMSDAGNRIQGNDTFQEIVALLKRAATYHTNRGN